MYYPTDMWTVGSAIALGTWSLLTLLRMYRIL